ncbi:MAG: hypothetical protein E7Z96_06370 [Actinomycetaceae bacterium]|nr:hypothetical protein [Actinomycetaceae bacterium]
MSNRAERRRLPQHPVRTDYALAEVELSPDGSLATLFLDGVESSALDLNQPDYLEFEYMQQMRELIDSRFLAEQPLHVLHLGAAGCAFPRALEARRPNSRQLAVEIDGALARLAREWFDLPASPRLRIRVGEARQALDTTHATWDVVVRDAFSNRDVPARLRTAECAVRAQHVLTPEGIYLLNSIASAGIGRVGEEARALFAAFDHVIAITDPAVVRGRRFGNIVLAASMQAFNIADVRRRVHRLPLPTTVLTEDDLHRRAEGTRLLQDRDLGPGQ